MQTWVDSIGSTMHDLMPKPHQRQYLVASEQTIDINTTGISSTFPMLSLVFQPPVYTEPAEAGESLVCQSRLMRIGEKYPVVWEGKRYVVVKTDTNIEFYEVTDDDG